MLWEVWQLKVTVNNINSLGRNVGAVNMLTNKFLLYLLRAIFTLLLALFVAKENN